MKAFPGNSKMRNACERSEHSPPNLLPNLLQMIKRTQSIHSSSIDAGLNKGADENLTARIRWKLLVEKLQQKESLKSHFSKPLLELATQSDFSEF